MPFDLTAGLAIGAGALAARAIAGATRESRDQSLRLIRERDGRRRRGCHEVISAFLNTSGYLAKDVAGKTELQNLIDDGITPEALSTLLRERADAVPGVTLGYRSSSGERVVVRLPMKLRARHAYIIGRTGSGKTTLLRSMIHQDMEAGRGLGVIAVEAEFIIEEILPFIPRHRLDDVVYVNPADTTRPVPFNPLHLEPGEDLDRKVSEFTSIFSRLYEDTAAVAPRMDTIFGNTVHALSLIGGATLLDIERLLDRQDDGYRHWVIAQISDPRLRHFWTNTYASYPKDAPLSLLNRLDRFLRSRRVRSLLCTPGKNTNLRQLMDQRKIVLFCCSDGLLGEQNAQLVGQLAATMFQLAAMSRADVHQSQREPFTLYLDEFQAFTTVATSYETMLSRARKYGLSLALSHQQIGQVPENLIRQILGNVATVIAFGVGASDGRRLAREFVSEVSGSLTPFDPTALIGLRVGEAVCRIERNVVPLTTLPPLAGGSAAVRDEAIRRSRERYGVPSEESAQGNVTSLDGIDPAEAL